jgi:hypothetical protein
VILGVITIISPFVFGFTAVTAIAWAAWILGVLTVLSVGSLVLRNRNSRTQHPTLA